LPDGLNARRRGDEGFGPFCWHSSSRT
jgi:hypothetical protein